ncbi:unnamed protein product [Arctia plantaginis]|uniref:Uncharacterized protein n=1 Tax=Arctia plantaginis TaxID=874455 RepID=A0A8S1BIZ6_ARCPL|nr:unnamed protein product [Arctia plantaginis]
MEIGEIIICATCMSGDRRLVPLHTMRNILKEINFTSLDMCNNTSICWECKGHILKFYRFKIKALHAQTAMSQNWKLKELKSLSSLVIREISNNYQHCYNIDPLVNCDNEPKLENNIIKEEEDDTRESSEVNGKIIETDESISHIYVDNISDKEKFNNENENILENDEKIYETIEENHNFNDENKLEINETDAEINTTENNDAVSAVKKGTIATRPKMDAELQEKFIRVEFSEEEIIQHRENKRNHYNFKKVPFKCNSCVLGFTRKETFDKHMAKKHDESIGPHKCDICEVRFASKMSVANHRLRHYSCYRCRLCKYDTTELWSALNHCKMKHKRDRLDSIHCTQCDTVVKTAEELEEHIQLEHSLHCNECGVRFKGKNTLRNHMKRGLHSSVVTDKRNYICDVCTRTFVTKSRLESHMAGHNTSLAKKLSYCHACKVQYKNIYVYRNHLKNSTNHSERAFSCPECNKKFASKVYWTRHYNFYHLHKSQYNCEICNKLFISDWRLKNHRQKHHGLSRPRNHPCTTCGKKFFSITTLRNHKLIHSEQRSYMCEDCGDTFKQRPALYTHAKLVHGDGRRK